MDSGSIGWLIVVFMVVGLPMILASVSAYFKHKQKMVELAGRTVSDSVLLKRVEALEKKCDQLQAQSVELQMQLADEQRQLDRKLSGLLDNVSK